MNVIIHKFITLENVEYTFEEGTTLIKGESGIGKSSIFEAVRWCLYGLIKAGVAHVNLIIGGLNITRKSKPKYLEVNSIYKDDIAQQMIINKFGSQEMWLSTSYIQQENKCYFLICPNDEKLEILNNLCFDQDPKIYIEKINDMIHSEKKEFDTVNTNFSFCIQQLKNYISDVNFKEYINQNVYLELLNREKELLIKINEFKLKLEQNNINKGRYYELRKNITLVNKINYDDLEQNIMKYKENKRKLIELKQELKKQENIFIIQLKNKTLQEQISSNIVQIKEGIVIKKCPSIEDVNKIKDNIKKYNLMINIQNELSKLNYDIAIDNYNLENVVLQEKNIELSKKYGLIYNSEINDKSKKILYILQNQKKAINFKRKNELLEKLKIMSTELKTSAELLTLLNQEKEKLQCPNCNVFLKYKDSHLFLIENYIYEPNITNKYNLAKEKENIEKELLKIGDTCEDIKILTPEQIQFFKDFIEICYYGELIISSKELKLNIEKKNKKQSLEKMLVIIEKPNENIISDYEKYQEIDKLEKKLKDIIYLDMDVDLKKIKSEIELIEQDNLLEIIEKQEQSKKIDELEKIIYDENMENKYNLLMKEFNTNQNIIKKAKNIFDIIFTYQKMNEIRERLIKKENYISDLTNIKEKLINAQYKVLESKILSINSLVNDILSNLFDEPITISINMFKELKSTHQNKRQINFEINYRGITRDKISQMSGGESARISLAIIIAFNRLFNTKMLLLDESMNSIPISSKELCLKTIKEIKNKFILIINHDHVEGHYDYVKCII